MPPKKKKKPRFSSFSAAGGRQRRVGGASGVFPTRAGRERRHGDRSPATESRGLAQFFRSAGSCGCPCPGTEKKEWQLACQPWKPSLWKSMKTEDGTRFIR